jgi:putative hydrolase of the HAD superfamily
MDDQRWGAGVTVVGFDGDDTLWHSEDAFAQAQEQLADLLAPHAPGEQVTARLHQVERRNLELFGYGVKGFTLSMIETAIELSDGRVPVSDIQRLLDVGRTMLARPVELLPGVADVVPRLAERYRLTLVTKGDLLNQESKIARSGLAELFASVHIVSEKDVGTYRRVTMQLGVAPEQFLMVGNSERSDVAPVVDLGGWAVHVPYRFTAVHELPDPARQVSSRQRTIADLHELAQLLGLGGPRAASAAGRELLTDSDA